MRRRLISSGNRAAWARTAAASLLLVVTAALAPAPAAAKEPVSEFVADLADEALRQLAPDGITAEERERRFRALLRAHFDLPRIARFVLGHHARQAGEDEMREFLTLYEDLMTLTYAKLFASYSGETFTVKRVVETRSGRYAMVMGEIGLPSGGEPIALDWQVLTEGQHHAVVDLRVEGVSMAITQRDEFNAVLDRPDGGVPGLLAELRNRIARLKAAPKG